MMWMSSLPTTSVFLLLLLCFPGQNGGENEQSTDVISVLEGDSISITCSMNSSANELGMYLKTSIRPINVLHVSKQNKVLTFPALANRIEYSKEGSKLRITLHNVQESDSNIYQCTKVVLINDRHKGLIEKSTIVVVKAKNEVIEQSPLYVNTWPGHSVNITCVLKSSHEDQEIYLLKTHEQPERVLYASRQNRAVAPGFAHRLEYLEEENKIVITLNNLGENDSGVYVCAGVLKNFSVLEVSRSGTIILIKGSEQAVCSNSSWVIYVLIIVAVLLFCALTCCALYHIDMKKYFQKRKPNSVYEDMSYSSRCNTLVRTNTYSVDN
ncbi:CD7 protein, partial [Urocolius indicus]|nr:CD7 protein [Urocolius indicus]